MEPPREPDPEADSKQHGAEQSSKRLDIKAKRGKKSKYSPKPCQMAKLCEGPMFPWGMMGNCVSDGETL
jgi:hypothetical protein